MPFGEGLVPQITKCELTSRKVAIGAFGLSALPPKATDCCIAAKRCDGPTTAVSRCSKSQGYSITSSASDSKLSESFSPSVLAVFRLIAISNLVGCNTGNSAGFAPPRTLPT
jgi:hypothetical protein